MHYVLNSAYAIREARLQAIAQGRIIPGVNDRKGSGIIHADYSDTSSISSTGSGSRFRRLRDTTDMARASLDSLRRGSKESLDELFKRGLSISRNSFDDFERKRASTGEMMTRSLSQRFSFANNLTNKVKRTSSVHSVNNAYLSQQGDQIHKDWLLANQLSAAENNNLERSSSVSSNASSRTGSLMNRFSQLVSSKPVAPYRNNQTTQQEFDERMLRKTDSAYSSSSVVPNPLKKNDDKNQLANSLNSREALISAYRGFV